METEKGLVLITTVVKGSEKQNTVPIVYRIKTSYFVLKTFLFEVVFSCEKNI